MQAMYASLMTFLAAGFAGLFVIFLGLGVGQVLIRSTISPVGALSDEELGEILSALPKLTQENIEYLKDSWREAEDRPLSFSRSFANNKDWA